MDASECHPVPVKYPDQRFVRLSPELRWTSPRMTITTLTYVHGIWRGGGVRGCVFDSGADRTRVSPHLLPSSDRPGSPL
ncbi:hypothetical protein DPEC_G00252790 [Dallia pectoralis]|uniref:Uncharacterized protein n=1 Tax=Dallia pectoralis TaxID=75939 RepID=A0ACC2FTZ3_DALPE|nr:hypothetical protein DPEC_G00252790 [Dallia pectoralis]